MPSNFLAPGFVTNQGQSIPSVTPDGLVSWRGQSMAPLSVVTALSGAVFSSPGGGVFPLSLVPGQRGTLDVQYTSGAVVLLTAATGTIVTVAGSLLVDTETFTLDDGVNPPVVFEFDDNASVTPGNVAVTFTGADSLAVVRAAIVAAINAAGSLDITAAPGGAGEVLLTNDTPGSAGNVTITKTVADAGFTVSGMSGGLDAGPERTILYLTNNLTTPTKYVVLAVDSLNRPLLRITNVVGTLVAEVTPSTASVSPGTPMSVRLSWDSENLLSASSRHASLTVNGVAVPDANWTTDPTADWASFQPTHLVIGRGLGAASDFNGVMGNTQISNQVSP